MRIPFISLFSVTLPFDGLQEHAEKVKECSWVFQHAIECHMVQNCKSFEGLRGEAIRLEREADAIKRRIRGHIPVGTFMNVEKFQLFRYLREQDSVLDSLEDALDWISYREKPGIPEDLQKDFFLLIDSVIDPVEELCQMVIEARKYFKSYSDKQRNIVKEIISNIRRQEHEADKAEDIIKRKVFEICTDSVTVFHMIRLAETIGAIADHAENAGDMMRAMLSK